MKAMGFVSRKKLTVVVLFVIVAILMVLSGSIYAQSPSVPPTSTPTTPTPVTVLGAGPGHEPVRTDVARSVQISGVSASGVASMPYTTYTYTHSDLLIFSYVDGTSIEVYDVYGNPVWSGTLNASEHSSLTPGLGVYRVIGSKPYSVCAGDELTRFILGYYALDQDGKGLGTLLYTYQSNWSSSSYDPHFIVFAYEDGTTVWVEDTVSGTEIWSGTLDAGQHYDNTTIDDQFLTVRSDKPVSALSYTDQGYYVPSENGTFVGIRFYTYVGNAQGWGHSLNIIAYSNDTNVDVSYISTGVPIWSGTLDEGEVHSISGINASFVTVTSDKGIAVNASPYGSYSGGYYHSLYARDSTGTGVGKLFYFPVISGGNLIVFSYENDSEVTITDSSGTVVWTGILGLGETHSLSTAYTVYSISSTGRISALFDWGDGWGADFAPVYYGAETPLPRGSIALSVSDFYLSDTPIGAAAFVDNPGVTPATYAVTVSLLQGSSVLELKSQVITVLGNSCSLPLEFEFASQSSGSYTVRGELKIGSELLDSQSEEIVVLSSDQAEASLAADKLTERALAELEQTEEIAVDVLADGIKRVALDPNKWSAEQVLKISAKAIAVHYGADPETVTAIENAVKLAMAGVKHGFSDPVEDRARQAAETIVSEKLAGRSDEVRSQRDEFVADVAGEDFTWNWQMSLRTKMEEFAIRTTVETRPFLSVNGLPPHIRFTSFLGQRIEYWAWEKMSWLVGKILLVLAAAVVVAFVLTHLHISVPAAIVTLAAGATKVATAIKTAGLINAVVVPVMMLSAALQMTEAAEQKVAPAIVETHDDALDSLLGLIQGSHISGFADFFTMVEADAYQVSLSTTIRNSGVQPDMPLVETYLYSADGSLIDVLASRPLLDAGEFRTLQEQVHLPAGKYRAVSVFHTGEEVAVDAQVTLFEVSTPDVRLNASLDDSQISLGEAVHVNISVANIDTTTGTGDLALFATSSDGQNFDSWLINLAPGDSQNLSYSFAPQANGSYVLRLCLTDGMSILAQHDMGYVVGDGAALAINTGHNTLYSPGEDVSVSITATNAGNQPISTVLSLVTLSSLEEFTAVHTTTVPLNLEAGDSLDFAATVLPEAQPGVYLTRVQLGDAIYDSFEFSVEAEDTLYALVAPDAIFHSAGDTVILTVQIADSAYVYTDATPSVTVWNPDGTSQTVSMNHMSTGQYQGSVTAPISGTYTAEVEVAKPNYRTVGDSSFFVVERPSVLVPNITGQIFEGQTTPITITVVTESGTPVTGATVVLTGTNQTIFDLTDQNGEARLLVQSEFGDELYYVSASKMGYLNTSFKLPVVPALDTEPPFIFFDSVFDGQSLNTTPTFVAGSTEISSTLTLNGYPVSVDAQGNFTESIALDEGANILTAVATDLAGNNTTMTITLHLDTAPPSLTVTSPTDGLETTSEVVNVVGTTEAGASISIGENVIPVNADGSFSAWTLLHPGANVIPIVATDAAGNTTTVTRTVNPGNNFLYLPIILKNSDGSSGFNSQFNDSASGWEIHSGTWTVDSNYYSTTGLSGTSSSVSYAADFTDFDYQVRLWRNGCNGCANRIMIRGTPNPLGYTNWWDSAYVFQYTRNGSYSVWKTVSGSDTMLQGWTSSSAINQGDAWNTLRVVANGTNLYYYINGTLVWSGSDSSLSSGRVGIGMYRSDTSTGDQLFVDWATLSTLGATGLDAFTVTDTVSPEQQALNDEANQRGGGSVNMAP